MFALVAPDWLPWAAAFLGGMLVKWLMDVFFLRRSMFETQQALVTRDRQITDLRHELNRSIETLKNRTTELDALVRSKTAAETLAAQRLAESLAAAARTASEIEALSEARSIGEASVVRLGEELRALRAEVEGERNRSRDALRTAQDLKLRLAEADAQSLDQSSAIQSLRQALGFATAEGDELRKLLEEARREWASQLTVNAALEGALQLRDTTLEGVRTQLASAESERQSVSQLLARQDEERSRLVEVQTALTDAEARCAAARGDATAARLQLESIQTQRIDFDAALMLKEAQSNAWERECRAAKNRADTAVRKSAADALTLESLKAEHAACLAELTTLKQTSASSQVSNPPLADVVSRERLKDLEAELAAVSESHARLESQLAETKALASRAEDLAEQLGNVEAELAAMKLEPPATASASGDLDTLLNDLDTLTRERNLLAAEVASLKASGGRTDSV